jgi:uncharacterized protein involved in copper resistance
MGDFVEAIGRGVGGLVGGSIDAISDAFDTVVGTLQAVLPGPLLPIAAFGVAGLAAWWFLRR